MGLFVTKLFYNWQESEIGAAKALQVQILDYLNNYPLQDIRMAFHLTSKEVRRSEKNLPQVEFSNDLLEDTVAQFTAIGSSKSDRLKKLSGNKKKWNISHHIRINLSKYKYFNANPIISGALIVLGSVMNPEYDLKSLEGPLPKVEPVIAEVLDELEKNCDQLLKMTKEEGKVDIMDKVESILISVMQHTKREMDKYRLNYDIAVSISETYGLPLDFQLPSWLEPSYTNDYWYI